MEDSLNLLKIAEALERIATTMENKQRRDINISRKEQTVEAKSVKRHLIESRQMRIREKIAARKKTDK